MIVKGKLYASSFIISPTSDPSINFIGTEDDVDFIIRRNGLYSGWLGSDNTSFGYRTVDPTGMSGILNVAIGKFSMGFSTGTPSYNTAIGANTLANITTLGDRNTAIGLSALNQATTGVYNTAVGDEALAVSTNGSYNTAIGGISLAQVDASYNTAIGYGAINKGSGGQNTAVGYETLYNNTTGSDNVAIGMNALLTNSTGFKNTALGTGSMENNTTGFENSFIGEDSGLHNIDGDLNCGLGWLAGSLNESGNYNINIGASSGRSQKNSDYNIFIGYQAGYNASQKVDAENTIVIGHDSYSVVDNQTILGNTSTVQTNIYGNVGLGMGTSTPTSLLHIISTQTTGIGATIVSSTTTTGTILNITGTSTALVAGNEGLNIAISGANASTGITATGARISVTNTNGTSGTNVGLDLTASGATTNNYALKISAGDFLFLNTLFTEASSRLRISPVAGFEVYTPGSVTDVIFHNSAGTDGIFFDSENRHIKATSSLRVIGGANVDSALQLQSTVAVGTTDEIRFAVGNNGATVAMTIINSGNVGIGVASPNSTLQLTGSLSLTPVVSSAGTLTIDTTASYWVFSGTTTTWTLPAVSGTSGRTYHIKNRGSGAITLNANGGSNEIYSTSAVNTLTINPGEAYLLMSDGTYFNTL